MTYAAGVLSCLRERARAGQVAGGTETCQSQGEVLGTQVTRQAM